MATCEQLADKGEEYMCKFTVLFLQLCRRQENGQNKELKGKEKKALRGMQHLGIY